MNNNCVLSFISLSLEIFLFDLKKVKPRPEKSPSLLLQPASVSSSNLC